LLMLLLALAQRCILLLVLLRPEKLLLSAG
jgi:hypothetical protein